MVCNVSIICVLRKPYYTSLGEQLEKKRETTDILSSLWRPLKSSHLTPDAHPTRKREREKQRESGIKGSTPSICDSAFASTQTKTKMNIRTILLAAAVLVVLGLSSLSSAKPAPMEKEEGDMSDALKYLEELDKYYSQAARPRWVEGLI